ncbi:PepSY domain-containing protein [uncultured Zhongshania sp.]|uniref:PepSY domain-containing protein n=1 Tax=uncultured Zhongshania sp. TaxID=1642288 RepID=UPI0030D84053|tara:strand:+ start:82 stop:1491 length:1410 start_codon:yes stop_codon:yes gene_type:complete
MSKKAPRRPSSLIGFLLCWHPRLGGVVGLAIIAWGLSGLAHPIISRIQPSAAAYVYKLEPFSSAGVLTVSDAAARAGLTQSLSAVRLLAWQGRPYYRLQTAADVIWVDARSGVVAEYAERDYAEFLARHYVGDQDSAVKSMSLQTEFDEDYVFVNRLLPVWRVEFERDDGMRVYVDTASDRLGTIVNNTKAASSVFFRNVHSWIFIKNDSLRLSLMTICLVGGGIIALAGILQYFLQWRAGRGWRQGRPTLKFHRVLGVSVALTAVTFTGSGLYHLWQKQFVLQPEMVAAKYFDAAQINVGWSTLNPEIVQADMVAIGDEAYFRTWYGGGLQYRNALDGELLADGERLHALALAAQYMPTNAPVKAVRAVDSFNDEYGFVNKRLPVVAVDYERSDHLSVYVEPRSGALATVVRDADRYEGFSFAFLHKWNFIDGLGHTVRDIIAACFAAGIAATFILGMTLFLRRARRR